MTIIIGRTQEQARLLAFYKSKTAEFLAIYGRRRVGKTFLIRNFFAKKTPFFHVTGIQKGTQAEQINRFMLQISQTFYNGVELKTPKNWYEAFDLLQLALDKFVDKSKKVVLFFDEFPWMVTHRSKLLSVLEYFWNQHWSFNARIKLIICGSSASWIIKKIINNKGGLHNRITEKIRLMPFNLAETKDYLHLQGLKLNIQQIIDIYMVTGGVPYYLTFKDAKGLSAIQIIEQLVFSENGLLLNEFNNLFSSLFKDAQAYIDIIRHIADHPYGIGQEELFKASKYISRGGSAIDKLTDLEDAGFIMAFTPLHHVKRGIYYRVIDEYTLFYLKWIEPLKKNLEKGAMEPGYWEKMRTSPAGYSWAGYAFEAVCYKHLTQIRKALKISPSALASTWRYNAPKDSEERGAQIDLLFDRKDNAITICEIKFTDNPYLIDKTYALELKRKSDIFMKKTGTKKQIFIAFISANGLKENLYAADLVSQVVTLSDLFQSEN